MVDDENGLAVPGMRRGAQKVCCWREVLRLQRVTPAVQHQLPVADLIRLDAAGLVRSVRDAFMVDDRRGWFKYHAQSGSADAEGEVRVLVIGGRKGFIEAAEEGEQVSTQHD